MYLCNNNLWKDAVKLKGSGEGSMEEFGKKEGKEEML